MLSEEGGGGEVIARQRMVRAIHRKTGLNASLGLGAIIDEMSRRSGSEGAKMALMAPLPSCLGIPWHARVLRVPALHRFENLPIYCDLQA